ncbi:hypothetical protein AMTR_s00121p00121190 [Amborella trichopoda]|uniref:Uncharacterized protein n=2 Tax=Amborella trichopoda TaxID=13333 RepID=W1NNX2_AMBTC|nr:hypothetical protein AMTR_s00121p00121190 [Amborella trichopoda]
MNTNCLLKFLKRNVVSWTVLITRYVRSGGYSDALWLFSLMQVSGVSPNSFTGVCLLSACTGLGDIWLGRCVHGVLLKSGIEEVHPYVGTSLIHMYAKCFDIDGACRVFHAMSEPGFVTWNAMLSGLVHNRLFRDALRFFSQGTCVPNSVTMLIMASLSNELDSFGLCRCLHGFVVQIGLERDVSVSNSLLDMYTNFGDIDTACLIFERMAIRDLVTWTTMMGAYVLAGHALEALYLFPKAKASGIAPDVVSMVNLLAACGILGNLNCVKLIHSQVNTHGFGFYIPLGNSLIAAYSKCRDMDSAKMVFNIMQEKSLVSWTAMISGYVHNGQAAEALWVLHQMVQTKDVDLDSVTLANVLAACSDLASLELCKQLHGFCIRGAFLLDHSVHNALIATYAKCGDARHANIVFDEISGIDTVSLNTIISGLGINGHGEAAITMFKAMLHDMNAKPDIITYLSVLAACSHSGLVKEGLMIFGRMIQVLEPNSEHCACIVDMLARAGQLGEAREIMYGISGEPSLSAWGALLGGCRLSGEVGLAQFVGEQLLELRVDDDDDVCGHVVVLCNVYASAGMFEEAERLRKKLKERGLAKSPGRSLICCTPTFGVAMRTRAPSQTTQWNMENVTGFGSQEI